MSRRRPVSTGVAAIGANKEDLDNDGFSISILVPGPRPTQL